MKLKPNPRPVYILERNKPETYAWLICAKRLHVLKEIARLIASFLIDRNFIVHPTNPNESWSPMSSRLVKTLIEASEEKMIVCDLNIFREIPLEIAGVCGCLIENLEDPCRIVVVALQKQFLLTLSYHLLSYKQNDHVMLRTLSQRSIDADVYVFCLDSDDAISYFFKHYLALIMLLQKRIVLLISKDDFRTRFPSPTSGMFEFVN